MNKKFQKLILLSISIIFLISFCVLPVFAKEDKLDSEDISDTEKALKNLRPILNIPFKTIPQFSTATFETQDGEIKSITVPWIAEYIIGVYQYALIIGAILAIIMIMLGGFLYMVSGARPELATKAKKMIFGSLTGLILLLGSYLVLSLINPELTTLKSITLESIKSEEYDLFGKDAAQNADGSCPGEKVSVAKYCGIQTNSTTFAPESFDQKFKDFATCGGFDWRILKGMAAHESGFQPYLINCACFGGLFQFKKETLEGTVGAKNLTGYFAAFGMNTTPLVKNDPRIFDTDLQTLGATKAVMSAIKTIQTLCPDTSNLQDGDIATLLYLYHNSGPGTLSKTLTLGGCQGGESIEKGVTLAWQTLIIERCKKNAFDKGKSVCTEADGGYQNSKWTGGDYKNLTEASIGGMMFGQGKASSVRAAGSEKIIDQYGAVDLFVTKAGGNCPVTIK